MRHTPTTVTAAAFAVRLATAIMLAAVAVAAVETVLAIRIADRALARESVARIDGAAAAAGTSVVGVPGDDAAGILSDRLAALAAEPDVLDVRVLRGDGSVLVQLPGTATATESGTGTGTSTGTETALIAEVLGDGQARQTPIGGADRRTVVAPVQVDGTRGVLVVALDTHDARQRARQLWLLLGVVLLLGALSLAPLVFLGGGRGLIRRYRQALAAGSTDDLTGLGTRRSFRRDLAAEVARASRHGHPLTVALLDVNGLELVNSTVGRRRGDALLAALGVALGTAMRQVPGRRTYRVGGDAFAVVMPGSTVDQAFAVTDDLRATISRTAAPLTANVGLSTLDPERCPDVETLLIAADAALFEARALGGNRVVASGEEGTGLRWVATSGTDSGRG